MQFRRSEFKFVVPIASVARLTSDLAPFVRPDDHADGPRGYRVRSLYYDSDDLSFYYQKLDGERSRVKVRLRHYGHGISADQPVFLEIKARDRAFISKTRLQLAGRDLGELIGHEREFLSGLRFRSNDAREHACRVVRFYYDHLDLRPSVQVDYQRTALVGRDDPRLRITIDVHVHSPPGADSGDFFPDQAGADCDLNSRSPKTDNGGGKGGTTTYAPAAAPVANVLSPHLAVLEVKFDNRLPLWTQQFITRHGLRRQSLSKYTGAVQASNLLTRLGRTAGGPNA